MLKSSGQSGIVLIVSNLKILTPNIPEYSILYGPRWNCWWPILQEFCSFQYSTIHHIWSKAKKIVKPLSIFFPFHNISKRKSYQESILVEQGHKASKHEVHGPHHDDDEVDIDKHGHDRNADAYTPENGTYVP